MSKSNKVLLLLVAGLSLYSAVTTRIAAGVIKDAVITRLSQMEGVRAKYNQQTARLVEEEKRREIQAKLERLAVLENDVAKLQEEAYAVAQQAVSPANSPPPPTPARKPPPRRGVYSPSAGIVIHSDGETK